MSDRRALRGALLVVVLAGGVLLGLLGMHALGLHGTAGAHGSGHAPAAATASHGAESHRDPSPTTPAAPPAVAHTAHDPGAAAVASPSPAGADGGVACVLALLGGLLLLLRHRSTPLLAAPAGAVALRVRGTVPIARPPSLHALCISRT
ncbi:hypothetical protein [Microbacterium paraoxydans]|uniref:hypothetical protein n=1 Tax=Microbacterium paraoxydans TaxID=199592 RepID=UPI003D70803D